MKEREPLERASTVLRHAAGSATNERGPLPGAPDTVTPQPHVRRIGLHFYDTTSYVVKGTRHDVIGSSDSTPGTKNVRELRLFLCRLIFKGVLMNASYFEDEPAYVEIDGVGVVDLNDEVPDCIDLFTHRHKTAQENANKTILARIMALKTKPPSRPATS